MALIQCPECRKEISDKAAVCPHCNFDIVTYRKKIQEEKDREEKEKRAEELKNMQEKIKCPECGMLVNKSVELCPSCGYPIQKEKKRKKKIQIGVCTAVVLLAIIIIVSIVVKNNSVESKIIGKWSCLNGDALWNYEFNDDYTGRFVGFIPGSNNPAFHYSYTWSYDKESSEIIIIGIEDNKEKSRFKILNFDQRDTIKANFLNAEKTLTREDFNYDGIIKMYGTYED